MIDLKASFTLRPGTCWGGWQTDSQKIKIGAITYVIYIYACMYTYLYMGTCIYIDELKGVFRAEARNMSGKVKKMFSTRSQDSYIEIRPITYVI